MSKTLISAEYPLNDSKEFLKISISYPELDPESPNDDRRCECKVSAPNYEKKFNVYGIDELQCVWLALGQLQAEISEFEKETNKKCGYHYFQGFGK